MLQSLCCFSFHLGLQEPTTHLVGWLAQHPGMSLKLKQATRWRIWPKAAMNIIQSSIQRVSKLPLGPSPSEENGRQDSLPCCPVMAGGAGGTRPLIALLLQSLPLAFPRRLPEILAICRTKISQQSYLQVQSAPIQPFKRVS